MGKWKYVLVCRLNFIIQYDIKQINSVLRVLGRLVFSPKIVCRAVQVKVTTVRLRIQQQVLGSGSATLSFTFLLANLSACVANNRNQMATFFQFFAVQVKKRIQTWLLLLKLFKLLKGTSSYKRFVDQSKYN